MQKRGREPERLQVDVHLGPDGESELAADVRRGLGSRPKRLPSKYFYDDEGSRLFDRICDTPEYYLTRAEQALLERHAEEILREVRPTDLVELGSGAARKTRTLLDAAFRLGLDCRYVPFDVSEGMLRRSAARLLAAYPRLRIHGVVGDYERHLERIPRGERRLVAFLGGTIGNFTDAEAVAFLSRLSATLSPDDRFLLGTDLVKDAGTLHAAYNDAAGLTAAFNRNVLRVINRELGARFAPERFDHVAFFDQRLAQIEMHLRARDAMRVPIEKLGMVVELEAGETIHTEISRKFTRDSVADLCRRAGMELCGWYVPEDERFALSLTRRARSP